MATDTALLTRQRVLGAKIETTTGTAISVSGSDGAINVMDAKIEETTQAVEREGQGSLSPLTPVPSGSTGKATFKTEIVGGGGSDPFWMTVLLKACGFQVNTGTWTPLTGPSATLTIASYIAGRLLRIAGAMGKVKLTLEAGKPGIAEWEFDGVWQAPSSASLLAPTYPLTPPPRFAGMTFTIGSTAYRVPKVEIDIDNTLVMREDPAAVDAASYGTGYHAAIITNRKITVKVSPEALALGTQDWFAAHRAGTTAALSCPIGSGTGQIITIGAAKLVLLNPPGYEDGNGIYRDSLEFVATTSGGADDELTLAAT